MRNLIIGLLVGGILGVGVGFAGGIFLFPYWFPPPPVNETVSEASRGNIVARGEFIHANPSDPVHHGAGNVSIYGDLLHLETDFRVGPGPKFHVYLVPTVDVTTDTRVQDTMYIDLGRLKAFSGSQNYPIPMGTRLRDYQTVVIWCEQFGVLISPAAIVFADG